jgi:hypothetical protein
VIVIKGRDRGVMEFGEEVLHGVPQNYKNSLRKNTAYSVLNALSLYLFLIERLSP